MKYPPQPRIDHSVLKYNKALYIFGGSNGLKKLNDFYELTLEKLESKKISLEICPSPRFGHSAVLFEDSMYVFGGWDGINTLNDIWQFNFTAKKWAVVEQQCQIASRYRHVANIYNRRMYVFGGVDQMQERFNDLFEYNFSNKTWKRIYVSNDGPSPRTFHKSFLNEGILYIIGGFDG